MFESKRKIDRRIRFQNSSFTAKLQKARGYKRPVHRTIEGPWENFLESLGLNSRKNKFLFFAFLIFVLYLLYFPNFFTVKNIEIAGLKQADAEIIKANVTGYLKTKSILPQSNLLLLSGPKLTAFLMRDNKILKVNSIRKKYPGSLVLDLTPRLEQYFLQSFQGNFLISGDGMVTSKIDEPMSSTSSVYSNLSLIKYNGAGNVYIGQEIFSLDLQNLVSETKLKLPGIAKTPIVFFELSDLNAQEISVITQTGYKIIFDVKLDIGQALQQLNLLLGQISPADQNKLIYVDMRFKNKGFACFKNTPCAVPLKTASSTPASALTPN